MLESQDITESSDDLKDFYNKDPEVDKQTKDIIAKRLHKLTERPLTRLDRILLKGFYSTNCTELENPKLMSKSSQVAVLNNDDSVDLK